MLYRVSPPDTLTWNELTLTRDMEEDIRNGGYDLDKLTDWQPSTERPFSDELLGLALRHGIATHTGIAVRGTHLVHVNRAAKLRAGQADLDRLNAQIRAANDPLMEHFIPGWTESGQRLDAETRENTELSAQEAERDLTEDLAAPIRPELVEHWQRLGGYVPGGE